MAKTEKSDPLAGIPQSLQKLNRYDVLEAIGEGGMGRVFRGWDKHLQRYVALKFFRNFDPGNKSQIKEIEQEAKNHASLLHPNIVTIYDYGFSERGPFTVMELIDGPTLHDRVTERPLSLREFLDVARQSLIGLSVAHQAGMLHRDLKTPNIMLARSERGEPRVKILDFGLSKKIDKPQVQTTDQEHGVLGSVHFMAPEQFNLQPIDARTDLYALGCIFYYCLAAQYPFDGETAEDIMVAHLKHRVKPLNKVAPRVPQGVSDWVMRMISQNPADRPLSAGSALRRLEKIAENPALLKVAPRERQSLPRRLLVPASALGLVLLLLALRFVPDLLNNNSPPVEPSSPRAVVQSVPKTPFPKPIPSPSTNPVAPSASDARTPPEAASQSADEQNLRPDSERQQETREAGSAAQAGSERIARAAPDDTGTGSDTGLEPDPRQSLQPESPQASIPQPGAPGNRRLAGQPGFAPRDEPLFPEDAPNQQLPDADGSRDAEEPVSPEAPEEPLVSILTDPPQPQPEPAPAPEPQVQAPPEPDLPTLSPRSLAMLDEYVGREVTMRGTPDSFQENFSRRVRILYCEPPTARAARVVVPDSVKTLSNRQLRALLRQPTLFRGTVQQHFGQVELLVDSAEGIQPAR